MTGRSLTRLVRMPREEVASRVRARGRIAGQRLAFALRRPQWRRRDIRDALAPELRDSAMLAAIAAGDWPRVHASLRGRMLARPSRYVLDPAIATRLRHDVTARWPEAPADAARRADRLLTGTHDLLGYEGVACSDWHSDPVNGGRMPATSFWASVPYLNPRFGDHKVIWELNRHQHWLALGRAAWLTGDPRYGEEIVRQLSGWLRENPPLTGGNWASMLELGFRSLSWLWAMHVLLGCNRTLSHRSEDDVWLVDMLIALDRQLSHIAHNLSEYFSPNTHLTGEALGLYVAGHALPELAGSAEWIATGRRWLLSEIDRQIAADGGHVERSTHYHRYTLDFYLLALATAQMNGDTGAATRFDEACRRLAEFTQAMAGPRSVLPLIGDDDGGMLWPIVGRDPRDVRASLTVASVLLDRPDLAALDIPEDAAWILGGRRLPSAARRDQEQPPLHGRVFADTGYIVIRGTDDALVFDVGPHGYLNAGHAHADALAVTLDLAGVPLLIDPGTSTYTIDPELRDRLRSSISHNTLTLDGRSSSVSAGPFQWRSRANARLQVWRGNGGFCWTEAAHDGYHPVQHRRSVFRAEHAGWLILDEVLGDATHRADVHWHFDPSWTVSCDASHRLRLTASHGKTAWLLHEAGEMWLTSGDDASGLGWYAPIYGVRLPTSTARVTHVEPAPFARATWIGTGDGSPSLERVAIECDQRGRGFGFRLNQDDRVWVTVLRPGECPDREARSSSSPDFHTDARLVHYGVRAGALTTLSLADASHLLALHDGLISVASETPVQDLHLSIDGERLEVRASSPPPRLRLEGGGLSGVRTICLNGREQHRDPGVIELSSSDWALCAESPALSI